MWIFNLAHSLHFALLWSQSAPTTGVLIGLETSTNYCVQCPPALAMGPIRLESGIIAAA